MYKPRPALVELAIVRTKEFLRETEAVFWVFGFPLLLALALGFAFRSKPPDQIPIGVVAGPEAAQRLAALKKSPMLLPHVLSEAEGRDQLRRGKISLLVESGAAPVYRFDPTRPEARTARVEADDALQGAAGRKDVFAAREEKVQEQGSRYIDFLLPGLLGMNLMGTGMWSMGFTIVNARMRKLLKRFVATPMRKSDYLLSQFLSRLVFLCLEVSVVVIFGWLVFGVKIHGSLLTFAVLCLVGGYAFAGIGILVASRAQTIEAVSGMMNFVMMPMWLCSGVFFSYERFPDAVKPVIRALPLTALNDALRAVMNDAAPLSRLLPNLAILLAWGLVSFAVGLKIFRWQ
ncbi:MAG TPA: ABC transporter permease [Thermoanaerobaculia bacterium]|jgi:ABC-type multidrug transport system permease subunit|nr:ABC transporter permease [Thermoanaerobaculia bacterium]